MRDFRNYDWEGLARPSQLLPADDDWLVTALVAGRGAGLTRSAAEWVRKEVQKEGGRKGLILDNLLDGDIPGRNTIYNEDCGLDAVTPPSEGLDDLVPGMSLQWPTGSRVDYMSYNDPTDILGLEADFIWADDANDWSLAMLETALLCLRGRKYPKLVIAVYPGSAPIHYALGQMVMGNPKSTRIMNMI